jgi:hypothetical protein
LVPVPSAQPRRQAPKANTLSPQETSTASQLRELAPLLSEGVTGALRDHPSDPAAYLSDFLASRSSSAAETVKQRQQGQTVYQLDLEIAALKDQLDAARQERARRRPVAHEAEAARDAAVAAASWAEVRRLKRLTRTIKLKISEPLSVGDWPLPEGVVLVQAPPGFGVVSKLCRQLAADFGIGLIQTQELGRQRNGASADVLATVADALSRQPQAMVLLEGYLAGCDGAASAERLSDCMYHVGHPTALLLLEMEHADELVRRLQEDAAERGERLAPTAAVEIATAWRDELAQLEESARQSMVPALRVRMDGAFNEQMTELLAALSLC